MHPAASVILFTTASGAGYGMILLLGLLGPSGLIEVERWSGLGAFAAAMILVTGGLLSSTFHLGHPERAWRALSQWRSSWLSREGVAAIVAYPPIALFALGWIWFESAESWWGLWGVLSAFAAMLAVYCTSKIYATLKTIRQWNSCWVTPGYLALSVATGGVWLILATACFGYPGQPLLYVTAAALLLSGLIKLGYWRTIDGRKNGSDPGTATGLGRLGKVRQLEPPHTGDNYVMREMIYRVGRKHARELRTIAFALGIVLPLAGVLAVSHMSGLLAVLASIISALSVSVGVFVERWLFFAEATHVVGLFYGQESA